MTPDVRRATPEDRPMLERLWLMYRHDLSGLDGTLPAVDGTFRSGWLDSALQDPDWAGYVVTCEELPAGLVFVRALGAPVRVLNSMFVVRGARGTGIGRRAVHHVLRRHPGRWDVPYQPDNAAAAAFWRRVATEHAADDWTEEARPVPHRPDVPPDVWLAFTVRP